MGRRGSSTTTSSGPLAGLSGFTDIELVAGGGSSQVYRARQPAMDRQVAVKVMSMAAVDPRVRARFERERTLTGRMSAHPLFVSLYDHGITDAGYPYLVMPWYDGGSLADVLERHGPMPVAQALQLGVRLAGALAQLHGIGIVHRDVKPGNVLLSRLGEAVLADFGGASRERDSHSATTVVSPLHVAPEVLCGRPAGAGSDVWALCSTICTALAGLPPFVVAGPGGQLVRDLAHLDAPPPPLTNPDVPPALRDLLLHGLAPAPQNRPGAADVVAVLRGVQKALGLPVTDVPALTRDAPPPRVALPTAAWPVSTLPIGTVAGDLTMIRPPEPDRPKRSWRDNLALSAAGALAGAVLAVGVLVPGEALFGPDASAVQGPAPVEQVTTGR